MVGDLRGSLAQMLGRVRQLAEKSGQFHVLLCVGQFFGDGTELAPFTSGQEKGAPIPLPFLASILLKLVETGELN